MTVDDRLQAGENKVVYLQGESVHRNRISTSLPRHSSPLLGLISRLILSEV